MTIAITSVAPNPVAPNQTLTVTGSGFGASQGGTILQLGGVTVTPVAWSATQITFIIPGGTAVGFNYVNVGEVFFQPVIIKAPLALPGGSSAVQGQPVHITGSGFGGSTGTLLYFSVGGQQVEAVVTDWSDTSIYAALPGTADLGEGNLSLLGVGATNETLLGTFTLGKGTNLPQGPVFVAGQTWVTAYSQEYPTVRERLGFQEQSRGQIVQLVTLGPRGHSQVQFVQEVGFQPEFVLATAQNQDLVAYGPLSTETQTVLSQLPTPPPFVPTESASIIGGSSVVATLHAVYKAHSAIVAGSSLTATASSGALLTADEAITASPPSPDAYVSNIGVTVTIVMTVSAPGGGDPTPTGTVTLYGGLTSGWPGDAVIAPGGSALPLSGGSYTYTVSSSVFSTPGDRTIGFTYSGDSNYNAATLSVSPTATISVYSDVPSLGIGASPPSPNAFISHLGATLTVGASVVGGGPTPTGVIDLYYGTQSGWPGSATGFPPPGSSINLTLVGGGYTYTINTASWISYFNVGHYYIAMDYGGDANYLSESYTFGTPAQLYVYSEIVSFTSFIATPSSYTGSDHGFSDLTITVVGAGGGAPTPTGTVTFWVNERGLWSRLGYAFGGTGNVASVSSPNATLTGLAGIYPGLVGQSITITSSTGGGNIGTFPITSYISGTSLVINNSSAVVDLTGDVAWTINAPVPSATLSAGVASVSSIISHDIINAGGPTYLSAQYSGDANYAATAAPSGGPPPGGGAPYIILTVS